MQSINQSKMPVGLYVEYRARAASLVFDSYEGTNTVQKDNYVIFRNEKCCLLTSSEFENIEIDNKTTVFFVRSTRNSILVFEKR